MKLKQIARPALLAVLIAASATAGAVTWDFTTSPPANHAWGPVQAFDTNPASGNIITAYGFDSFGVATNLYSKWSGLGSDETGLGLEKLDPEGDREVTVGAWISFDMSAVQGKLGNTYTIGLGSLQSYGTAAAAENADIFECHNAACTGVKTLLGNVTGPPTEKQITLTLDSGFSFLQVFDNPAGGGADVLVDYITVPEPATLGLLGLGLAAVGLIRRRKSA